MHWDEKMKIRTECQICGQALAKYTCRMCGKQVCESCYNRAAQACVPCSKGKTLKS